MAQKLFSCLLWTALVANGRSTRRTLRKCSEILQYFCLGTVNANGSGINAYCIGAAQPDCRFAPPSYSFGTKVWTGRLIVPHIPYHNYWSYHSAEHHRFTYHASITSFPLYRLTLLLYRVPPLSVRRTYAGRRDTCSLYLFATSVHSKVCLIRRVRLIRVP